MDSKQRSKTDISIQEATRRHQAITDKFTAQAHENFRIHAFKTGDEAWHLGNPDYVAREQMDTICSEGIVHDRYVTLENGYVELDAQALLHWDNPEYWDNEAQDMWNGDDADAIPDEGVYYTECDIEYQGWEATSKQSKSSIPGSARWTSMPTMCISCANTMPGWAQTTVASTSSSWPDGSTPKQQPTACATGAATREAR